LLLGSLDLLFVQRGSARRLSLLLLEQLLVGGLLA